MTEALKLGQTVETTGDQQGVIRYIGPIHVSDGIFVGIELSSASGKNDGSIRGERYFTCPPLHGLFIKDSSIIRIVSQPTPARSAPEKAAARPKPPATTTTSRTRPSSVFAPKAAPKTPAASKRQSVASSMTYSALRPHIRSSSTVASSTASPSEISVRTAPSASKPSIASSRPSLGSNTSQSGPRAPRDSGVETLQTRIRFLEKQHLEAQERLKELAQTKDERDRYHTIIQKLQSKCQTQHVESQDLRETLMKLQEENGQLSRMQQEHEVDLEDALVDKEMAEERADQADTEIELLQKRLEERDLELDILREEATLFTTEMTEDQKQEAGYYRLQHENDRLRNALVVLKEMTEEKEHEYKVTILGLEADASQVELYERENGVLQEQIAGTEAIISDFKQRLDAANEWEDMVGELSNQNQDFQERIAEQNIVIEDLENLKELNDELEIQHIEQEEELREEVETLHSKLLDQQKKTMDQEKAIAEQEFLVSKFRDLVFDLQSRMTDVESQRIMTEAQAKDNAGKFNQVMDLNRRLRAANVQATIKEITSQFRTLRADEATEQLNIQNLYLDVGPREFGASDALRAYFTAKRIAFKASLESTLIVNVDRQMSYNGSLDEALSRLYCVEAVYQLSILKIGTERLWSAMMISSLPHFATFGPSYQELFAIEKTVDQGLDALKADEVNFAELANSLGRSARIQEGVLIAHQAPLSSAPEDETSSRFRLIVSSLEYLDANFTIMDTMLQSLASNSEELAEKASEISEKHATPSASCKVALLAARTLEKTVQALRQDSLYPIFLDGLASVTDNEAELTKAVHRAAEWAQNAVKIVSRSYDLENDTWLPGSQVRNIESFHWVDQFYPLDLLTARLNQWNEHASVLMNSIEIEHGPPPWTQKAQEVEACRKKSSEAAVQLQQLTTEHRVTLLKIHEREQAISTKELEIEHLIAKNRDIAAKAQDVEVLQAELAQRHDKIKELEVQHRAQTLEVEALRERAANSDQSAIQEQEQPAVYPVARIEPADPTSSSRTLPAGFEYLVDALQNQNRWLRQREQAKIFDNDMKHLLAQTTPAQDEEERREEQARLEGLLNAIYLSEADEGEIRMDSRRSSNKAYGYKLPALSLASVKMGSTIIWSEDESYYRDIMDF